MKNYRRVHRVPNRTRNDTVGSLFSVFSEFGGFILSLRLPRNDRRRSDCYGFRLRNIFSSVISLVLFSLVSLGLISLNINCGKPKEFQSRFRIISKCANPGYAQSVWVDKINNKNYAFVASGQAGMVIYNVDNPESTYIKAQWFDTTYSSWSVKTLSKYAYITSGKKLVEKVDVGNIDSLRAVFTFDFSYYVGYGYDIATIDTNYVCVAARERFYLFDLSVPGWPYFVSISFPNCARGVFVVDSLAYIACEQLGLYITKVKTSPLNISIITSCNTPSNARGLFVKDNICYIADGRNGLVIIDAMNPSHPTLIGQLNLDGYANRNYVKDTLAYVACGSAGLAIVNIKDKSNPILVETIKTSYAKDVFVTDDAYIYVADRDEGLIVIKQEE